MKVRGMMTVWAMLWLGSHTAGAHETWLTPSTFRPRPGERLTFSLTSGLHFPALDYAIRPERIATARCRVEEKEMALRVVERGEKALRLEQSFTGAGEMMAWVTLRPKRLELSEEKVAEYFDEIAAPAELRAAWRKRKGRTKWREIYTKCAKTFVVSGAGRSDRVWPKPVGMPVEVVPLSDPGQWRAGGTLRVRLLEAGRPLAQQAVGMILGKAARVFVTTDEKGEAEFRAGEPGPVLLLAVHLRWREKTQDWSSLFTTFCGEVR